MKFHGITMAGKFILEKLDNLPTFNQSRDGGRLVLDKSTDRVYYGQENEGLNTNNPDEHDHSYHSDIDQALLTTSNVQFNTINGLDLNQIDAELDDHIGSGGDAHSTVTTSIDGFMSSVDKSKLNGIDINANNYTLETHNRNNHSDIDQALLTTSNVGFNRVVINGSSYGANAKNVTISTDGPSGGQDGDVGIEIES